MLKYLRHPYRGYRVCIYIGIMEKKMDTAIMGLCRVLGLGFTDVAALVPENTRTAKKKEMTGHSGIEVSWPDNYCRSYCSML